MCKRRATPLLSTPPTPGLTRSGRPPAPQRPPPPRPLRAPRAPLSSARSFPGPTSMRSYYSFKHCSKLQQGGQIETARAGAASGRCEGPGAHPCPPAPAASRAPFSPHEQRSRGLALHLGAAVPRSPPLELVPRGASHRCEFPLRPGGVRCLTGTMWLGVVRSRLVPHEGGGWGEGEGESGGWRGGS